MTSLAVTDHLKPKEPTVKPRKPMDLKLKKGAMHKDVGKEPGEKITKADIAKEKAAGGVKAKRAVFAENARKWNR
jgi:hypothetical protein